MKPAHLGAIVREIALEDLDATFAALTAGTMRGRAVVRLHS